MSSETTSAAPAAREHFWVWRMIIGFFAGIWQLIHGVLIYILLLGIGVSLAASWLTSQDNADPSTWRVSQYLSSLGQNLLVAAGVFGLLAFVAFVAWRADTTKQMWEQDKRSEMERIRTEEQRLRNVEDVESGTTTAISKREGSIALDAYGPIQMPTLKPRDCVVDFVDTAYQERDADSQAHEILRAIANRAGEGESIIGENIVGICVVGHHNSGKSRLLWEALSHHLPELQAWRFLPWPLSEDRQFPIEMMKGQRVVVLVDRLEKYAASADPRVSRRLNRLAQQFADAKIPLIVIATHRGADRKVPEALDGLLASLETIELSPISPEQATKLEADLQRRGMRAHTFDGITPGSIVEGRATEADYEHLSPDAQQVMKVLRLFASVGIGNGDAYVTKARVCAVASALFDMPHLRWRSATDELIAKDLVEGSLVAPAYERVISAMSDDVLDIVSDYPLGGKDIMELEDWPLLHEVFKEMHDAAALVALGVAWKDSRLPLLNPGAPSNLDNLVRSADCFRTALEIQYRGDKEANPSAWALVELYLADVLSDQNFYMQTTAHSPTRLETLQESATSYQAALEHFTHDNDPETWLSVTSSLAVTLNEQAKFLEGATKTARLDEARRLGDSALAAIGTQTSPDITRAVKNALANISLDCAQVAATPEEAAKLEAEAYEFASAALRVLQDSDPETRDKDSLALAQTTLGRIIRFQASLVTGEARSNLLKQVEALLHEALNALPEASAETIQTQMWTQSVLAETLLQHARGAATMTETQERLTEAEQLCRDVMSTVAAQRQPESLAWIQGVYAGVLAHQAASAEKAMQEALLGEAWEYCAVALDVPNKESVPEDWAGTRFTAAALALHIARFLGEQQDDEACSTLDQARQYLTDALGVYSRPAYFDEQRQALALHEEIIVAAKELACSV
jgi:hypothetical protein